MNTPHFDRFSAGRTRRGSEVAENIQIAASRNHATLWPFGNITYLVIANVLILLFAVMLAILPLLLAHAAAQCQTSNFTQNPGTHKNHTLCVGSTQRSYLLFLPKNYDEIPNHRPLILSYHGFGKTATNQLNLDLLTTPYFNNDSIVAYPQGIDVRVSPFSFVFWKPSLNNWWHRKHGKVPQMFQQTTSSSPPHSAS